MSIFVDYNSITMKASLWFIILTIFIGSSLQAQKVNKKIMDAENEQEILIGICNRDGLQEGDFGNYFKEEYEAYEADQVMINNIYKLDKNIDITIVLGTWCHDSQEQVPRFYRILDEAKITDDVISVIGVDGNKTGGELDIERLGIELVPTFIFYRKGEELGRIIETPEVSLEADMWEIIK